MCQCLQAATAADGSVIAERELARDAADEYVTEAASDAHAPGTDAGSMEVDDDDAEEGNDKDEESKADDAVQDDDDDDDDDDDVDDGDNVIQQ